MSLLTPSESHAFQSFLTSIDYDYSVVESLVASAEWTSIPDDLGIPVPHAGPAKEALAKATKDLITLPPTSSSSPKQWEPTELKDVTFFKPWRLPHNPTTSGSHPTVPQDIPKQRREFDHLQSIVNNASSSNHSHFAASRLHRSPTSASSSSSATTLAGPSRPLPSKRSHSEDSSSSSTSHKRQRPLPSRAGTSTPSQSAPGSKPTLLSASQKKANHIQSEQKRRANIRRGYEALCETIPALREAIRAEDEANNAMGPGGKKRRRSRVGDDGEKADGRAGPRSENIVLAKSKPPRFCLLHVCLLPYLAAVEYIQHLLAQRQHFTERLQRARAVLPPGHAALGLARLPGELPLWEREWTGGLGAKDDDDAGDASGDDDEP